MIDPFIRSKLDPLLTVLGRVLYTLPIHANHITLLGLATCVPLIICLAYGQFTGALGLIIFNRLLDGLDGTVARHQGTTDFGGYLDIVCDFLFYSSVPIGFALYAPENGLASSLLLASFIGTSSSFLAYAIIAAKHNRTSKARGEKSFYHLGGLIEGTESIFALLLFCLLPEYYIILAMIFAGLCLLSTSGRIYMAYRDFTTSPLA